MELGLDVFAFQKLLLNFVTEDEIAQTILEVSDEWKRQVHPELYVATSPKPPESVQSFHHARSSHIQEIACEIARGAR